MKLINYWFLRIGLPLLALVPVGYIYKIILRTGHSETGVATPGSHVSPFRTTLLVLFSLAVIFIYWLSGKVARHMAYHDRKLGEAIKESISDLRQSFYLLKIKMAFLPLIGPWFAPKDATNADEHEESPLQN